MHALKEQIKNELNQIADITPSELDPTSQNYLLGQEELLQFLLRKIDKSANTTPAQVNAWLLGIHAETETLLKFMRENR